MRKGFRKAITLESNQSRLTAEGALTAAAIGLMMMLVLQQQQTQASGGEEPQSNSRLNFDATRVPTGRIAVSQASLQDAARLRQASAYTPPNLGDVEIDDVKSANRTATANQKPGFALNESRIPYSSNASSTQGGSGLTGAENQSSRNNSNNRSTQQQTSPPVASPPTESISIGASSGPGRGDSGAPITVDTSGARNAENGNGSAATPSIGAILGPGKGATGIAGGADQTSLLAGKSGAAVQELASAGALAGPGRGSTGLAGSFSGNPNSGGGGAPQVVTPSAASASLEYRAFDGPMAGSTAYMDTNNNGYFDTGDWYTYTDDAGYFSIDYVDSNKNGIWEQTEAIKRDDGSTYYLTEGSKLQVRVIGGTDTVSNSLNRHEMVTSLSGTGGVVSPITTLVEGISKDLGMASVDAEKMVSKILGLDDTIDLLRYDPFSITVSNTRSLNNNDIALDYKVKAAQIFNLGYVTEAVSGQGEFNGLESLGKELARAASRSDGSIGTLDLTATDDLKTYFDGLSSVKISDGALDAFSSITQQANSLIKQSGASSEVLSVLSGDRSIDGLGSNKLLNSGINSSRDLLADVLKRDASFSDGGAAKLIWDNQNAVDGSVAFEALHKFIGLPSDKSSYTSLPQVELKAEHRGETNAIASKGNAIISTYESVSLLKDAVLDYSNYTAKTSITNNFAVKPISTTAAAVQVASTINPSNSKNNSSLPYTPISSSTSTTSNNSPTSNPSTASNTDTSNTVTNSSADIKSTATNTTTQSSATNSPTTDSSNNNSSTAINTASNSSTDAKSTATIATTQSSTTISPSLANTSSTSTTSNNSPTSNTPTTSNTTTSNTVTNSSADIKSTATITTTQSSAESAQSNTKTEDISNNINQNNRVIDSNIQKPAVISSTPTETATLKSQSTEPLTTAQVKATEIAKDLSNQPASEFTGKPILLEAIHEHSINGRALDGAIEADISHQTRVLNRSTLLMGGQDDVLRLEATTDINISLFESMGVELHGEISSVAMEFSKLDMGGGDDIIEINSVLSLEIDSSEDIAKLIGNIDQEELGMLDSILMGGDGNDTMVVNGAVRSRIDGGTGNDDIYLTGESQFVTLDGGAGDDRIFGTKHSETLNGGDGDDLLFGLGGLDEMTGGRGSDIFIVDMDESVDLGNLNALSDFEKTLLSGKISNAELASITDFNGMEGDAIALRGSSIGVTERAQDLFTYTPAASDMDKQVLLLSNFSEFFFSGQVEMKEGFALLTDLDTLIQITDEGNLHAIAHVTSQVTPSNGMVFTTNNSLSS